MFAFIKRLIGKGYAQIVAQRQLDESLKKLDDATSELDGLNHKLEELETNVKHQQKVYKMLSASSGEHLLNLPPEFLVRNVRDSRP